MSNKIKNYLYRQEITLPFQGSIPRRLSIIWRNKWTWSKGEMRHNRKTFNLTGWIVALASFAEGHEITILKHHNII